MAASRVLEGKSVLITGSTGIAESTAVLAAEAGAKVFIVSRTAEHAEALAKKTGGRHWTADLTAADAAESAVAACGRVDALFNVAGISGRKFGDGPLDECSDEGWSITFDTNVTSMFRMCRAVLKRMLAQAPGPDGLRGSILNMASVLGFSPQSGHFATHAYAASKGAILGMSKSMAAYYAPRKIRVNVIAPSLVRTPMSTRAQGDPAILSLMKTKQPLAEDLIDAVDVARSAVFLLGSDSRMITGDALIVDAGWCVSG